MGVGLGFHPGHPSIRPSMRRLGSGLHGRPASLEELVDNSTSVPVPHPSIQAVEEDVAEVVVDLGGAEVGDRGYHRVARAAATRMQLQIWAPTARTPSAKGTQPPAAMEGLAIEEEGVSG